MNYTAVFLPLRRRRARPYRPHGCRKMLCSKLKGSQCYECCPFPAGRLSRLKNFADGRNYGLSGLSNTPSTAKYVGTLVKRKRVSQEVKLVPPSGLLAAAARHFYNAGTRMADWEQNTARNHRPPTGKGPPG